MKDSVNSIFDMRSELQMLRFHTSMFLTTPFFLISVLGSCFSFSLFKIFSMIQGSSNHSFWVYSSIATIWASTILSTGIIGYQRYQGTLDYLFISPKGIANIFYPIIFSATTLGLVLGVPCSILLSLFFGVPIILSINEILALFFSTVACASSSLVLSSLYVLTKNASSFENFPLPMRIIAYLHPLTPAVKLITSATVQDFFLYSVVCLILSIAYVFLGRFLIQLAFSNLRKDGDCS